MIFATPRFVRRLTAAGMAPRLAEALADKLHGAPNSSSPYSDDLLSDDPEPETYLGMDWEEYQRMYNHERPHSRLGYRTPEEFAETQQNRAEIQGQFRQNFAESVA